jgi:acyl-CoA reductase-like NAD-dependent aldehyde dehydrogenase
VAEAFRYFAELSRHDREQLIQPGDPARLHFILKESTGSLPELSPVSPLLLMAWKISPATAAANTVITKPSELALLTTLRLVEVACDHFPSGVVDVNTWLRPEAGYGLVTHPDVRVIAFTGSPPGGQHIAGLAEKKATNNWAEKTLWLTDRTWIWLCAAWLIRL